MIRFCDDCCNHICTMLGRCEREAALAAGSRRAKTPKAVECEASQSGPKGNAQTPGEGSSDQS